MNCGRTLFGNLPTRNQQSDQQYFGPIPNSVRDLLNVVEAKMLEIGVPMAVKHNEVAPGQHEMCPIFCLASASCDNNIIFMEICTMEAAKRGLVVLFHEKPFKGINGNGKHNNWSVGTDTGINFFYPGKDDDERLCFVAGIAALSYGLMKYNELVRISVAHAGNDHRLGAQEAPPAIVSLYPGTGFEAHVDNIIAGGELLDYKANKQKAKPGCNSTEAVDTNVEDRNRTAPFPFCGNRFEFRAVGSSQNCALPTAVCNTVWAAGAKYLSTQLEAGTTLRDAVAAMFKESRNVIFTGNGYSIEWPVEAKRRGLPNLNTTPMAIDAFVEGKSKEAFTSMNILSKEECTALGETMYENYITTLSVEAETMIQMVNTAFLPAFAKDLLSYKDAIELAGDRNKLYGSAKAEAETLKSMIGSMPEGLKEEAAYLCNKVKPQMEVLRKCIDEAELLIDKSLYPYPTYETILYAHHF
jgi:glutamine synthetase